MGALIHCAGADVQSGRISLSKGAWWADLKIGTDSMPSGTVTIEAEGGITLHGTVTGGGVFLLTAHVEIVGGAAGLAADVSGSYLRAELRDPLGEILRACGETQSSDIAEEVLAIPLDQWTLGVCPGTRALDELCAAASAYLDQAIGWRVLPDGSVWLGAETWPAQALPSDAVIIELFPSDRRAVIGCATPSLLPFVDLAGVGRVSGVDHEINADRIRSVLWT